MSIKSSILFPILSVITLLAAGAFAGAFALLLVFVVATVFLVHLAAKTLAWLCRPLAPAYCSQTRGVPRRSAW